MLELATRPVMATHSCARALLDHHRNLTDEQLRGIAATGGTVCVNFLGEFLATDQADRTVDRLAEHIIHIADVIGVDHVGLGPDFIKEVGDDTLPRAARTGSTPSCSSPAWKAPAVCLW